MKESYSSWLQLFPFPTQRRGLALGLQKTSQCVYERQEFMSVSVGLSPISCWALVDAIKDFPNVVTPQHFRRWLSPLLLRLSYFWPWKLASRIICGS